MLAELLEDPPNDRFPVNGHWFFRGMKDNFIFFHSMNDCRTGVFFPENGTQTAVERDSVFGKKAMVAQVYRMRISLMAVVGFNPFGDSVQDPAMMLFQNFFDVRVTCSTWNIKGRGFLFPSVPFQPVLIASVCPEDLDRQGYFIPNEDFDRVLPVWIGFVCHRGRFFFDG